MPTDYRRAASQQVHFLRRNQHAEQIRQGQGRWASLAAGEWLPGGGARASGGSRRGFQGTGALNSALSFARLRRYTWHRMAWRFRKSLRFGPLRFNLSKSGVGYSIGGSGFRAGQDARGRSYTVASIPGTGLYSRTYSSQGGAAGGNAAPVPGAGSRQGKAGLAVGILALAFGAGVLVTLFLSAVLSTPPAPPPAPLPAMTAPVAPPAFPAKRRRAHRPPRPPADGSKPASAPTVPQPST
jgi:hypothetical protein